ncbi:MAG: hypothetical protein U0517_01120 [Candidatus Andersenbacteria bacterium]
MPDQPFPSSSASDVPIPGSPVSPGRPPLTRPTGQNIPVGQPGETTELVSENPLGLAGSARALLSPHASFYRPRLLLLALFGACGVR